MKKIYLLLITILLTITLCLTEVSASNSNEIIPFHPDPSLVTEWDVGEEGYTLNSITFDTPILKVIIPEEEFDGIITLDSVSTDTSDKPILWIYSEQTFYSQWEIYYIDSDFTTIWLGGRQSAEPTIMEINYFQISDGTNSIEDIYIYTDVYIYINNINTDNYVKLYSYNFEYELNAEYQSGYNDGYDIGYNDGWSEKNKMTDITFLVIGLIIFIIANVLGFIYKNNLLTALSGLLWLLPIFLVDNVFIKIFSVIIMIITFLFSFRERSDYYV